MFFKTKDGTLKDPEIQAFRITLEYFQMFTWDEKGIRIHNAKDSLIEGWGLDLVEFLTKEEWEKLIKEITIEEKKKASYIV